jgi:hypothetical protein
MIRKNDFELWSPPVWVDFMARDEGGTVPLHFPGTVDDLKAHKIELNEGQNLTLYTFDATENMESDELVCVGRIRWSEGRAMWTAEFDWESLVHVSEMDSEDRHLYLIARPGGLIKKN